MPTSLTLAALALGLSLQSVVEEPAPRSILEAAPSRTVLAIVADDLQELGANAVRSAWADVLRAPAFAPFRKRIRGALEERGTLRFEPLLRAVDAFLVYAEGLEAIQKGPWGGALRLSSDYASELLLAELPEAEEVTSAEIREIHLWHDGANWWAVTCWSNGLAWNWSPAREDSIAKVAGLAQRLEHGAPEGNLAARLGERRSSAKGAIEFYLDLQEITKNAGAGLGASELALWDALRLDDLGWMSMRATLGPGVQTEVLTRIDLPATGLLADWAACVRPAPLELAELAPADTVEVVVLGFDTAAAWRALCESLSESSPEVAERLHGALRAANAALGVNLERDCIDNLTGEFAEFLLPIGPKWSDPAPEMVQALSAVAMNLSGSPGTSPGSALVVGLKNSQPVRRLLEQLVELSGRGEDLEDEEVAGHWMSSIDLSDVGLRPSWAFVENTLIVSMYAEPVRLILRQTSEDAGPPWIADEDHRAVLAAHDEGFASSVSDIPSYLTSQIIAPLNSMFAIPALAYILNQTGFGADTDSLVDELHTIRDALPELVAKHLQGDMCSTVWVEGNSLRYRSWSR